MAQHFFRNTEKFIQIQQILKINAVMHGLSRNVCMSSRGLALTILNWSPDHGIFLEADFLWAPSVRSVRIVKCCHYLPGVCQFGYSSKAFIYSLTNNNDSGHAVYNPVKLPVKPDWYKYAVRRCTFTGPRFGRNDIYISNNATSNQESRTSCGKSYPLPPGYSLSRRNCTFYAGSFYFTPTDIEVFYETTT